MVEGRLSIPFTYAGTSRRGIWDESDVVPIDATGYDQTQQHRSLLVMTEDGPYADFSTLVADGVTYQVRKALRQEDGATTLLILAAT
jgi:hypothetical protein